MTHNPFSGTWPEVLRLSDEALDVLNITDKTVQIVRHGLDRGLLYGLCSRRYSGQWLVELFPRTFEHPLILKYVVLHEHCHMLVKGHGRDFAEFEQRLCKEFGLLLEGTFGEFFTITDLRTGEMLDRTIKYL